MDKDDERLYFREEDSEGWRHRQNECYGSEYTFKVKRIMVHIQGPLSLYVYLFWGVCTCMLLVDLSNGVLYLF